MFSGNRRKERASSVDRGTNLLNMVPLAPDTYHSNNKLSPPFPVSKKNTQQRLKTVQSNKNGSNSSARAAAISILLNWQDSKAPIDSFFNKAVSTLSSQDIGLAKTMVYGVLRQKQYLDFILEQLTRKPLRKLDPRTLITLEVGAHQLLFLDRIPASAAVNETVKTLKGSAHTKGVVGFVNGVLRNLSREKDRFPAPEQAVKNGNPVLNHPQWLTDKWRKQFGREQTTTICHQNNVEPILTIRVNTRVTSRDNLLEKFEQQDITAQPSSHSPEGIYLPDWTGPIPVLPGYEEGAFQVQDESAQLATFLLMPLDDSDLRVLDGCAGLGGKTSHLAQHRGPGAELVAVEPEQHRLHLLKENLQRLGLAEQTTVINATLEDFALTQPEGFDRIILDVPCSGTGVIRRHPDIRWNRRPKDLQPLQQTQHTLLETGASLLNPDGLLVYATCSIEPEENEQVIEAFLAAHPDFSLVNAGEVLPVSAHQLIGHKGLFTPLPTPTNDGFFAALLHKSGSL